MSTGCDEIIEDGTRCGKKPNQYVMVIGSNYSYCMALCHYHRLTGNQLGILKIKYLSRAEYEVAQTMTE